MKKSSNQRRKIPRFHLEEVKNIKTVAAILGPLLGGWGIHKFYLGKTTAGILTILLCGGVFGSISFNEFITYLAKSKEDFYKDYIFGNKQ